MVNTGMRYQQCAQYDMIIILKIIKIDENYMVAGDEEFSFPGAVYYQLCEIVVHLLDRTNFD